MKEISDPYAVLELRRGATQKEIRSACRRLIKRYHPDKNSSAEAPARYAEIRAAYETLCQNSAPSRAGQTGGGGAGSFSGQDTQDLFRDLFQEMPWNYGTAGEARFGREEREKEEEEGVLYIFGRRWKYAVDETLTRSETLPFSLWTLPEILVVSVSEVLGVESVFRAGLTSVLLWMTLAPMSGLLAVAAIFATLAGSAVFRYLWPGSAQRYMGRYFVQSFRYGVGMSAVFALWDPSGFPLRPLVRFLFHVPLFYAEVLPLWIHPLAWAGEVIDERRKRRMWSW